MRLERNKELKKMRDVNMMGRPINKIWFLLSISAVIAVFISFEYSKAIDLIIPEKTEREPDALEDKSMLQSDGQNFRVPSSGSLAPTPHASDPAFYYYDSPVDCKRQTNFNDDIVINFFDYAIFANSWQTTSGDLNYNERCDLIVDGFIDYNDLFCFCEDWLLRQADYAFDFTNMTPEIQESKNFAVYSEHRPFWDIDKGWNAIAWESNDITIESLGGNKVLSIDADFKIDPNDSSKRKGYVGIEAFPNIDISDKDCKVIQFRVMFEYPVPEYGMLAQVYAYNRRADPATRWFEGPNVYVVGAEWQEVSFDLSDYPEEELMQLLKVGIQFWGNNPYTGKIYIDDISIGGVEFDDFNNLNKGFVTANGTDFMVNGKRLRFVGNNCYYPFYKTHFMTNDLMDTMQAKGLKVLRTWGFCDGLGEFVADNDGYTPNGNEECTFQPKLGKYDELTFIQLDYVIKCAGEHGIRLIIPLVNYWSDKDKYPRENAFGGVAQYVEWAEKAEYDTNGCITNKDLFYTDPDCKQAYKNYVAQVINRINTLTQIAYKDDPTILAWELANEPEAESDTTGDTVYNWAVEISAFVKSLDPNHMVAVGDCGFMKGETDPSGEGGDYPYNGYKGVDWIRNLGISDIDFGTVHVYPDHWFQYQPDVNQAVWANAWIKKHITDGNNAGKPIIFEEFGRMRSKGDRDALYTEWTDLFYGYEEYGAAGDCVWMIAGKVNNTDEDNYPLDPEGYYPDYDGFTFWDHNQTASTMDIIENHEKKMNSD